MKVKVAKFISQFLVDKGVEHCFTVTGGGAMHLNDAFGHQEGLTSIYNHHEQASAIAAEAYARYTGKVAALCVTTGPGGTNAITGVIGGWQDSIPMFVVSGQVKRETTTWSTDVPLRQLGDQEFQIIDCAEHMAKYAVMVTDPESIRYHMEKAWYLCNHGRKGPVWIDVPVDVQAALIETDTLKGFDEAELETSEMPSFDETTADVILEKIRKAKRPVIYAGTAVRLANACPEFNACIKALQIPVVTEWNGHDIMPDDNPYYCGRPGTVGTRAGNFVVQNADLLLVLGSRLNIRQISYNYKSFAKNAYKIVVDIDKNELRKPTVHVDMPVHADVKDVMRVLTQRAKGDTAHPEWLTLCKSFVKDYPAVPDSLRKEEKLNPYVLMKEFSDGLREGDAVICGNGSACVITFQAVTVKPHQRLFTNSGCAAMGYGFPASVGVAIARRDKVTQTSDVDYFPKDNRTICIDGDGSFQMNIQELQTVAYHRLNLKIIVINNRGYHSIRQTQTNLFKGQSYVGIDEDSGISFPDLEKIAYAYGLPFFRVASEADIKKALNAMEASGPLLIEAVVDEGQNFEPKLSSRALPDGTMVSPELDDMFPFIPKEELEEIRRKCREI